MTTGLSHSSIFHMITSTLCQKAIPLYILSTYLVPKYLIVQDVLTELEASYREGGGGGGNFPIC